MRIAIISDTHSRLDTIKAVLKQIEALQVDLIIHCGDIEDGAAVYLFPPNSHFVYGNCDSDRAAIKRAIGVIEATLHEPHGELECDGQRIAFVHSDDARVFQQLEQSGRYDFLFYGHTHIAKEHRTGRTRVINPGALHRAKPKTFIVLDLPGGDVQSFTVAS